MSNGTKLIIGGLVATILVSVFIYYKMPNQKQETNNENRKEVVSEKKHEQKKSKKSNNGTVEEVSEQFIVKFYEMDQNESFNSKAKDLKGIITDDLSKKLFSGKDKFNLYDDIRVSDVELDVKGNEDKNVAASFKQIIPDLQSTDGTNKERIVKAYLKLKKIDGNWMIYDYEPGNQQTY